MYFQSDENNAYSITDYGVEWHYPDGTILYGDYGTDFGLAQRNPYVSQYGPKVPTRYKIQYGDGRWRRVYAMLYGNSGSVYITVNGKNIPDTSQPHVIG